MIWLIIVIVLFTILVVCLQFNTNDIVFLTDPECLLTNSDNFFTKLNRINLYARNCSSIQEYKERIKQGIYIPNIINKFRIRYHISMIKKKIKKMESTWVNINKFMSLPWRIVIFDTNYEARLPHTRLNVIALPKDILQSDRLAEVLLHEQLHVYQKAFPNEFNKFINLNFYTVGTQSPLWRVNPDTNDIVYKNKNNKILSCRFNSSKPINLYDVYYSLGSPRTEHPYELVVYDFVDLYAQIA